MDIFKWEDRFDVGNKRINDEHKHLIDLVNELYHAMAAGKSKAVIDQLLNNLATYGIEHFNTEEKMFKAASYPGAARHIEEHEKFKAKVTELLEAQASGSHVVSMKTMHFLREWVTHHILEMDMAYKNKIG